MGPVLTVPRKYLMGGIVLLCLTGAFAVRNSFLDVVFAVIVGFVGYAFRAGGFSLASLLIGLVVGHIAEEAFGQGMLIGHNNLLYFFGSSWASRCSRSVPRSFYNLWWAR